MDWMFKEEPVNYPALLLICSSRKGADEKEVDNKFHIYKAYL